LKLDTNGKITTQLVDKLDDFNFSIVNFAYLCRSISVTCLWYIYRIWFGIQNLFDIRSDFSSKHSTDKQIDVAGVSRVSFTGSFPQILWSLQQSYLPIRPFVGPHGMWCAYSRSCVNQIWVLKNWKELLENLKAHNFSKIDSIKTYDFSTLYTTIPHN
jgi:hypothetical protein